VSHSKHGLPPASSYRSKLSRRDTLKWIGVMSTTVAIPVTFSSSGSAAGSAGDSRFAPWPQVTLEPATSRGYGQDPDLITPQPAPWPRLMSEAQLALTAVLADIIVPAEDDVPSASEVGVPDVIDEWISAPYPRQQQHRAITESGLLWMDNEARRRNQQSFVQLQQPQQLEIVEDIAYSEQQTVPGLEMPVAFFDGFRTLVVGAFFTSPEGIRDIGYIGNTPIRGDYPGPTAEAMAHLDQLLSRLGLSPAG
jgi:hypothetical protein